MSEPDNRIPASGPTVRRTLIHRGAKFDFEEVEYPGSGGRVLTRQIVRHPGAVVILPIADEPGPQPRLVLIRNRRIPAGVHLWELPAGTREAGEPPDQTAARELAEETGCRARTLLHLGTFYTSPGLSDEKMWAYAATGLTWQEQALEDDEHISVHPKPVGEVLDMIDRGELNDAKSMLTVLLALRKGVLDAPNKG